MARDRGRASVGHAGHDPADRAVLGIHFRSPVTPVVILLAALVAYVVSLRSVGWVGDWIGVDHPARRRADPGGAAARGRDRLRGLLPPRDARALDAGDDAADGGPKRRPREYLPIVVTAGLIVAGGTAALMAGELEFFRAFGPGMALTVLVSLAVAITLVPALMAILGARIFWPRGAPLRGAPAAEAEPPRVLRDRAARGARHRRGRDRRARDRLPRTHGDEARRDADRRACPSDSQPRRAQDAAAKGFAPGILSPTVVLLEGARRDRRARARGPRARARRGAWDRHGDRPGEQDRERAPRAAASPRMADAARFLLVLDEEPQGGPAIDTVEPASRPAARCCSSRRRSRRRQGEPRRGHGARPRDGGHDHARPDPHRDRRLPRQLPLPRDLPARDRRAALPRARLDARPRGHDRDHDARLPGLPRPRRADLPRAVRGRGAAALARARTTTCSSSGGSGRRPRTSRCARRSPPRRPGPRARSASPGSRSRCRSRRSRSSTCASSASSRSRCALGILIDAFVIRALLVPALVSLFGELELVAALAQAPAGVRAAPEPS